MKEERGIVMKTKNVFHIALVFAVVMTILVANVMQASASNPLAPKTRTPTPGGATSTPTLTPTSGPTQTPGPAPTVSSTELTSGFSLRSATNVTDPGSTISTVGYNVAAWYPITVPSTVMASLVANNVYQNVFFGTNL